MQPPIPEMDYLPDTLSAIIDVLIDKTREGTLEWKYHGTYYYSASFDVEGGKVHFHLKEKEPHHRQHYTDKYYLTAEVLPGREGRSQFEFESLLHWKRLAQLHELVKYSKYNEDKKKMLESII